MSFRIFTDTRKKPLLEDDKEQEEKEAKERQKTIDTLTKKISALDAQIQATERSKKSHQAQILALTKNQARPHPDQSDGDYIIWVSEQLTQPKEIAILTSKIRDIDATLTFLNAENAKFKTQLDEYSRSAQVRHSL